MLYVLIVAALVFNFLNGFHDSSNIVATVISSRALHPRTALWMTAIAEFAAPFLFGVAVANTFGAGLVEASAVTLRVVIGATLAAILWNIATWLLGIPSSSSHALFGGLLGAVLVASGMNAIHSSGLIKILVSLFISPPIGLLAGYVMMHLLRFVFRQATRNINVAFKRLQIVTALGLALSHGTNDAQKTMGIITLGLVIAEVQRDFSVPVWVIAASAGAIALGSVLGGWRLIRTLGGRIYKIRPEHAFASQAASASVILGAALLGGPVSTTQVVGSAIMGAGAAERLNKVRWQVGGEMLTAWILTIPITAALAAVLLWGLERIF